MTLDTGAESTVRILLLGVGPGVVFGKEACPQQLRPLLLGLGLQLLVEHLVGEEPRSQVRLVSAQLT